MEIGVDNEMTIDGEVISVQIKVSGSVLRYWKNRLFSFVKEINLPPKLVRKIGNIQGFRLSASEPGVKQFRKIIFDGSRANFAQNRILKKKKNVAKFAQKYWKS